VTEKQFLDAIAGVFFMLGVALIVIALIVGSVSKGMH
jgi:hypothetical protein